MQNVRWEPFSLSPTNVLQLLCGLFLFVGLRFASSSEEETDCRKRNMKLVLAGNKGWKYDEILAAEKAKYPDGGNDLEIKRSLYERAMAQQLRDE